jgi:hypothetical protein
MKRVFCKREGYNKQTSKQITAEDTRSGFEIIENNNEIHLLLIYGQRPCVPCGARSKTPVTEKHVKTKIFSKRYGTKSRIDFMWLDPLMANTLLFVKVFPSAFFTVVFSYDMYFSTITYTCSE